MIKKNNHSRDFINGNSEDNTGEIEVIEHSNKYKSGNIEIEVGTIHSAKGQTHTATLYLETFYKRGYGNYESERLRHQFLLESIIDTLERNISSKDKIKQSAKMAYVGFSRPTHLLCFAMHKDRYNKLNEIDNTNWEIVDITDTFTNKGS